MKYDAKSEQALMTELWDPKLADDLLAFVLFAYPWGQSGTPLENFEGPRTWQREDLEEMTVHIKAQKDKMTLGIDPEMWRKAMSSGRGPGKSAFVSWLVDWMLTTRLGSTTIITANTEAQLKSRTFAEIGKWTRLLINAHWFETTVLSVRPAPWFGDLLKDQLQIDTGYYYAQGQLWSEENPDAFAGVHNINGVMVIYDEASGIPAPIWTVTSGFFTEPTLNRFWSVFSNPRRNSGGFYDCFHDHKKFWKLRQLDSRTVEGTDKALFESIIDQHGIDSDAARVEVLGQFPKQGSRQFISSAAVREAQLRELVLDPYAPLVMGVDIARMGDDMSVIRWRQGRDARSIPPVKFKNRDNMYVANEIAKYIDLTQPDAVNIDAGNGTGVIDRLREMRYRVNEVWFGSTKGVPKAWANKRTFMYAEAREWLVGGVLDSDPALFRDLTAPDYDYYGKAQDAVMLESKDAMRSRGLPSPDDGDAFVLTFAVRVARRDNPAARGSMRHRQAKGLDYNLFGG